MHYNKWFDEKHDNLMKIFPHDICTELAKQVPCDVLDGLFYG